MKHNLNDIWQNKAGEYFIKVIEGDKLTTKCYYRYLVEQYIGYPIPAGYSVHHIDYDHTNNTLSNFLLVKTTLHVWIHRCGEKNLVSNLALWRSCKDTL